jgi:hypothetical protein
MRRAIACLAILMLGEGGGVAQSNAPPRDTPTLQAGTAVIAGTVVDAQSGRPIARARVRLATITARVQPQSVLTNTSGAFAFSNLPAGRFVVSAEKSTYLPGQYPDAGQTLRSSGSSLLLGDGEKVADVVIRMQHGGAITGHIVDAGGDPVEFAQVQAFRVPRWGGKLQSVRSVMSDDLGQFRIPRLESGRYLLLATPSQRRSFTGATDADAHDPESLPTFYPGTTDVGQAAAIIVARGETVPDIELPLQEGVPALVSGMLVDAGGRPVGGSVVVRPIMKEASSGGSSGGFGSGVRPDGTFEVRLPPGEYELEGHSSASFFAGRPPGAEQIGVVRVRAAGDVSGVTIQVGPGATISGRLAFEGSSPLPSADSNVTLAFLPSSAGTVCRAYGVHLLADWTFSVEDAVGTCVAHVNGTGRWLVKSILYKGENLMDRPLTVAPGQDMRGVEFVMTDERTDVHIHVADERGSSTREYVALLFSTNRARWSQIASDPLLLIPRPAGVDSSARAPEPARWLTPGSMAFSVSESDREDVIRNVPAGEYYAVALDDLESDEFHDPAFLEQLARVARRITLTAAPATNIQLRRITLSTAP